MKNVLYFLGELDDTDVEWLISAGQKERAAQGIALIREGEPIEYFYLVLDGLLSVTDIEVGGQELAQVGAGAVIGELGLIDSRPAASTVTTLQETVLLSIPKAEMQTRLAQNVGFAARFYRAMSLFLADRLRGTVTRLGSYAAGQPLDPETSYDDELDEHMLDNISLAGDRFERILKRLMNN